MYCRFVGSEYAKILELSKMALLRLAIVESIYPSSVTEILCHKLTIYKLLGLSTHCKLVLCCLASPYITSRAPPSIARWFCVWCIDLNSYFYWWSDRDLGLTHTFFGSFLRRKELGLCTHSNLASQIALGSLILFLNIFVFSWSDLLFDIIFGDHILTLL